MRHHNREVISGQTQLQSVRSGMQHHRFLITYRDTLTRRHCLCLWAEGAGAGAGAGAYQRNGSLFFE
jgi:hypothetical protein